MTQAIKQFLEADALRTQGEWFQDNDGDNDMIVDADYPASSSSYIVKVGDCGAKLQRNDSTFIAAASRIAPDIRQLLAAFEQVCGAIEANNLRTPYLTIDENLNHTIKLRDTLTEKEKAALTAAAPYRKLMERV